MIDRGHPLAKGLACRMLFNEATAGPRFDIAGNNRAALSGSAITANTLFGKGTSFDASGSGLVKIAKPLVSGWPLTMMGWIFNSAATGNGRLLTIADEGSDNEFIGLNIVNSTGFASAYNAAAGVVAEALGSTDCRGKWRHICGVWDSDSSRKIYVDGRLDATNTTTKATNFASLDSVAVGALQRQTILYGSGVMTNLSLWAGRALTATEVLYLFNNPYADIVPARRQIGRAAVPSSPNNGRMFLTF
jgi:hypothetical protein